jgi:hypothetical protein
MRCRIGRFARLARPSALPRLLLAALLASTLVPGLGGCDDDGEETVVDAGPDGGLPACRAADCASQPMPQHVCMNGGKASYVCARNAGGACRWDQPVCAADNTGDASVPVTDGPNSEVGDGAGGDALDAPADAAID